MKHFTIFKSWLAMLLLMIGVSASWAEGKYVKVTSAPTDWCGDYLIVYEEGNVAFDGSLTTLDAVSNTQAVTISDDAIAATDAMNAIRFTVAYKSGSTSVYSLKSASGSYISGTTTTAKAANGLKSATTDEKYEITFAIEGGNAVVYSQSSDQKITLRYNKAVDQARFRFYKTGQEPVALYKYEGDPLPGTDPVVPEEPEVTEYASLAALVAAGAPTTTGATVKVTLKDIEITGINKSRTGIYTKVGDQEVEIFCQGMPADEAWAVGGKVSGTLTCPWKLYNTTWELCPDDWSGLTYTAPEGGGTTDPDPETPEEPEVKTYASLADLVAAGTPTTAGETVTVTLKDEVITKVYVTTSGYRNGIFLEAGGKEIEIFSHDVPEAWVAGGKVSGTLTCPWKLYNTTWELCPDGWSDLTYTAPEVAPEEPVIPVYASLSELIEGEGEPTKEGKTVTVTLNNDMITGIASGNKGVYLYVGPQEMEIYCSNVPEDWKIGGKLSGTLTCPWKLYNTTWELCPTSWDALTYTAPVVTDGLVAVATGTAKVGDVVDMKKYLSLPAGVTYESYDFATSIEGKKLDEAAFACIYNTVTFKKEGVYVVDIAVNAKGGHEAMSGQVTITVTGDGTTDPDEPGTDPDQPDVDAPTEDGVVAFIFNTDEGLSGLGIAKPEASAGTPLSGNYTVAPVTMKSTGGTNPTRVWNSQGNTDLRVYKDGGSLTFSVPDAKLTKITFTGDATSALTVEEGTYDDGVWTGEASSVTFTATATCKISTVTVEYEVEAPATSGTLQLVAQNEDGYWATFSAKKGVFFKSADATVYTLTVDGEKVVATELSDDSYVTTAAGYGYYVPAGTGVLVKSNSTSVTYYMSAGSDLDELLPVTADNLLRPATEAMTGAFKFYKLAYDNYTTKSGLGFYYGAANGAAFTCKAGGAYLAVPAAVASVKGFVLGSLEDAIKSVEMAEQSGAIYDMQGRRVEKAQKGLYIVNGKKVVVK